MNNKRKMFRITIICLTVMILTGSTVYATSKSGYQYYGLYYIRCAISLTSKVARGETEAAPTSYYNYASIAAYDANGVCKGTKSGYALNDEVVIVNGSELKSAKSYHAVADSAKKHLYAYNKQIKLSIP